MWPVVERAAAPNRRCDLGDICRDYGEPYRHNHALPLSHLRVMRAVERCRTAALGGHLKQCDACGFEHPAYYSCRNRHCPKCQSLAKARWLEKQKLELLPVGYFHLVFTVPHELNRLILINKKPLINILFHAVSQALFRICTHAPWRNLGLDHGAAHLGPNPLGSFSSPLSGPRRSFVERSKPLNPCPQKLPVPCHSPEYRLPRQVSRLPQKGFRSKKASLPRTIRSPSGCQNLYSAAYKVAAKIVGRLRQETLRFSRLCPRLSRPLHPPRGALQ